MKRLTDNDPMPFGKYGPDGKALLMKDVPADYLVWFAEQKWSNKYPAVEDYVNRNWKAIQMDTEMDKHNHFKDNSLSTW